jgi:Holliday junction DNA helicase RuvB
MDENQPPEGEEGTPTSLAHLIGQRGVVAQVEVALDAAQMDGGRFDHSLLVGPPGLGKSALARVIAAEMASELHEVLGQSVAGPADLNAVLLGARARDVIHIDECHELPKAQQTALYMALDRKRILLNGCKAGLAPQSIPLADFTLLLSSTDEYSLLQPLRDRMKLTLRFDFYSPEELVRITGNRSRALAWRLGEEVLPEIARRSRGTPRLALRLPQSCRRVCRSEGEMGITAAHLERACRLEGLDDQGLGPTEQKYLDIIAQGASRLNVIASILGLPSRTVAEVTEPYLIRAGLVVKDDQGRRQLTAEGRDHLHRSRLHPV